jgi:RNA polymerase sigma factor (sigma-70 family)
MRQGEPESDGRLLELVKADPAAFEAFYRRHIAGIMRYLAGRCESPEDVADATAATFLAVLMSSNTFDPELGTPSAWLYAIARNEASAQKRASNRRWLLSGRMQARQLLSIDDTERIAEIMDAERRTAQVLEIVGQAPEGERDLVGRIMSDDMTPSAAAKSLGITSGAGRVRLMRLRARIHATLADSSPQGERPKCSRDPKEQQ